MLLDGATKTTSCHEVLFEIDSLFTLLIGKFFVIEFIILSTEQAHQEGHKDKYFHFHVENLAEKRVFSMEIHCEAGEYKAFCIPEH